MRNPIRIFFFLIATIAFCWAQNKKADSLLQALSHAKHDTTRYNIYQELGTIFMNQNPDTAIYFYKQAIIYSKSDEKDLSIIKRCEASRQIGWVSILKGNYERPLKICDSLIKIITPFLNISDDFTQHQSKKVYASILNNVGTIYYALSNYSSALDCYFKSLKIFEELENKKGQASNLGNIGNVYRNLSDYNKALDYYFKALKIAEELGNKQVQANNFGNIGNVYRHLSDYSKSLDYYSKALKIAEELGNKQSQAIALGNIGNVYANLFDYSRALDYCFKALKIAEELGNKEGQAITLGNIGEIYRKQNKLMLVEQYLLQAEGISKEIGDIYHLKDFTENLSELYAKKKNFEKAYSYYKEHIVYRDSVFREENEKAAIVKEMQYNFEKAQALKEAEHQKEMALRKAEQKRQKVISYSIGAGLLLVAVFSIVLFNRLQVTRKQKRVIEEQKQVVEQQKKLVEEKNKDIMDSIHYARRIQDAILPDKHKWQTLLPNSFILYLPKDVIAGDFYWLEEDEEYIYVAAADCTGHGVPGAMVSVVCSNALTKSVLEDKLTETNAILNRAREIVIEKLSSHDAHLRDGMDLCLVRISKSTPQKLQFSGANRSLLIAEGDEVKEIKGDKQPIGWMEEAEPFRGLDIEVKSGSKLYLTTDGYGDQFGGEKGKKIGSKRMVEEIKRVSTLSIEEQGKRLREFFLTWKGNSFQIDDVTMIGIKYTV